MNFSERTAIIIGSIIFFFFMTAIIILSNKVHEVQRDLQKLQHDHATMHEALKKLEKQ
jgi:hypothetical protein